MPDAPPPALTALSDAQLVDACLSGNRDSFAEVVARYQSLVCSLAYSGTGSLSHSEDLAQETFLIAWKQLRDLREPERLRPWLCGIARHTIGRWRRRHQREPSHMAAELPKDEADPALRISTPETVMGEEEEAILWRCLERIPETYREPLILYYREHQSIKAGDKIQPAIGWIALGDRAYGILFAAGGLAVGAISVGGVAVGILAFGGAALGGLALGGVALGGLAMGGAGIGIMATGGLAMAWIGAEGGLAMAREFALGGKAMAQHANDPVAREFFAQYAWMDITNSKVRNWIVIGCWLLMVLVIWHGMQNRKSKSTRGRP